MLRIQGAIDPHVHLRGMEWSNKGTFASETAAAIAGGFTAVLDMPNTPPATLGEAALSHKLGELEEQARCDYGAWLGADPLGLPTDDEMRRASRRVCGLKLYCGHTTGGLEIDRELMEHYVRAWPGPGPLGLHDEDVMIGDFLDALGRWGKRGHVCHIHSAYSVRHLREAKEAGVQVTAGVTPHHLFLTEEDLPALGPKAVMKPLLGSAADRDALWEALLEGLIDMVETDHAPHAWEEKQQPNPAFGVTGLETCIPLLCTAAAAGRLPLEKIPVWVSEAPRRVFGLPAPSPDTYTLVDLEARWTLDANDLVTACGWSPFEGMELQGRVHKVVLRGRTAFEDGQVLAEPGWGANLYAEDLRGRGGEGSGGGRERERRARGHRHRLRRRRRWGGRGSKNITPGQTADESRGDQMESASPTGSASRTDPSRLEAVIRTETASRPASPQSSAPQPTSGHPHPNPIQRLLNGAIRRSLITLPPEPAHRTGLFLLRRLDHPPLAKLAARLSPQAAWPTSVGRVQLESPLILAAGLVKGDGYSTNAEAMDAVGRGRNVLAGWRSLPALLGAVEMGSFTPSARLGNSGRILWRDTPGRSLYNRVGLRNPGAKAAARFLGQHADELPAVYGISIAADPADRSMSERLQKLSDAAGEFVEAGLRPAWMTLNLSCPNTEDSLPSLETPEAAGQACEVVRAALPSEVPLWAKLSPQLAEDAYAELAAALSSAGVEAVVAVNTLRGRAPGTDVEAGLGGRALREEALQAVKVLSAACEGSSMQIVGCGGVSEGADLCSFLEAGASAVQYWSALVFRGPLAPVFIASEAQQALGR